MKLGYVCTRQKKEIEAFRTAAVVDELYIDLTDEFGMTEGKQLNRLLGQVTSEDIVVIKGFKQIGNLGQLCSFLSSMNENGAKLQILDKDDGGSLLSENGFKIVSYIDTFIKSKEANEKSSQKKVGRPARKYPEGFYEVYTEYRNGEMKADVAFERLGLYSKSKFYEFVRLFEA